MAQNEPKSCHFVPLSTGQPACYGPKKTAGWTLNIWELLSQGFSMGSPLKGHAMQSCHKLVNAFVVLLALAAIPLARHSR